MSKKMLKRSLALGALMAFVITGSAMAAEPYSGSHLTISSDGKYEYSSFTVPYDDDSGIKTANSGIKEASVIVDSRIDITAYCNGIVMYAKDGILNVEAPEISIVGGTVSGGVQGNADNSTLNIKNFNKFNIDATKNISETVSGEGVGIRSANSSSVVNVIGNENSIVTINSSENGIYASGNGSEINISNVGSLTVTTLGVDENEDVKGHAVVVKDGIVDIQADKIVLNAAGVAKNTEKDKKDSYAIYVEKGTATFDADNTTINGTVKVKASESGSNVNLYGETITINADGNRGVNVVNGTAVNVAGKATVTLGSAETKNININDASYGILVQYNGTSAGVKVEGAKLNITGGGVGIWAMNGNLIDGDRTDNAQVVIGENTTTTIKDVDAAIYATSKASVNIDGNLYATAKESVVAVRGDSVVNINATKNKDTVVQLDGDVIYTLSASDVHPVDSKVNINLTNEDSWFKGSIYRNDVAENASAENRKVTGMSLGLFNGATWNLTGASIVNNATFGADSNLVLKGDGTQFTKTGDYALNGVGDADVLTIEKDALITIESMDKVTYNVATGFETITSDEYWTVVNDNALMKAEWDKADNNDLKLVVSAKDASELTSSGTTSESTSELIASITTAISEGKVDPNNAAQQAAADFIQNVVKNNPTPEGIKQATDAAAKMAEAGGNSATAANIVKNVTGVTNDRLSFNCGHSAPHKGGHGVGLFEEGSGADIWAEYVHGKDKVEDMPSSAGATSYEGQYNGFVMGVDFKKVNKFQSGIAFNYGEGDTNSVGNDVRTHSDYDFWGVGYYGSIHNDDSNVIFDISYAQTDSDVTQNNSGTAFEANPETTTWSAGVKLEKLYQNENVQIVPYTGLRYMSIDADDYSTRNGEFYYSMDRQDIWLLPLGVSIRQEIANDNGWTVSPRVDLSYIWAFGDTNSNMEVKSPFAGVSQLGYDVMDDGSFLGLVGIEAHKGQWGYGVAYSYQKGDHSESKKWYVDVNYSF